MLLNRKTIDEVMCEVHGDTYTKEYLDHLPDLIEVELEKHKDAFQKEVDKVFEKDVKYLSISILAYKFSSMVIEYLEKIPYIEIVDVNPNNLDTVLKDNLNNKVRHYTINRFRNKVFYTVFVDYMNFQNPEISGNINLKQMYSHMVFLEEVASKDIETNYKQLASSISHYVGFLYVIQDKSDDTLLF